VKDRMRFFRHEQMNVVEAVFDACILKDDVDAQTWAETVHELLAAYGDKVWLLINLDGLVVRPNASAQFGKLRADVLGRHAHASVRYGGDPWTLVSIHTSADAHGTHGAVYRTREEALDALLQLRTRAAS
jgi:hypothetical protein